MEQSQPHSNLSRPQYKYINPHSAICATFITILIIYIHLLMSRFIFPQYPSLVPFLKLQSILAFLSLLSTINLYNLSRYDAHLTNLSRRFQYPHCYKCGFRRPPRTHHCSTCRRCIPRMSHHCALLGVCIGTHNHKPFIQLLFHGVLSAFILAYVNCRPAITSIWYALHPNLKKQMSFSDTAVLVHAIYLSTIMLAVLVPYLGLHLYLIAGNWTMLEAFTLPPKKKIFPPHRVKRSPFFKGILGNFRDALGSLFFPFLVLPYVGKSDFCIPEDDGVDLDRD